MLSNVVLLIILGLIFCLFGLISNITGDDCKDLPKCQNTFFNKLSIVNKIKEESTLSVQNYVLVAFVFLFFFIVQFLRYNFRKLEMFCDQLVNSPSDYSIIIRRLPPLTRKQDIEAAIDEMRAQLTEEEK